MERSSRVICRVYIYKKEAGSLILESMYHSWGSSGSGSGSSTSSSSSSRSPFNSVRMDGAVLPASSRQPPPSSEHSPTEEELPRATAAVGRYSAEERRERIEKYRSKRNHRNFERKITYACRKTLADSRPRVKGRFARNSTTGDAADGSQSTGLAEVVSPPLATTNAMCNDDDDDGGSGDLPEWWPAMQEALARQEDDDEDLLAAYLGVSSINLYSPRGHSS
uniref:CCT domain-containing protein n=1 Tax=Oryza glumipatula TaxID=40148 RepID=A0A0E0BR24_9ORYZ